MRDIAMPYDPIAPIDVQSPEALSDIVDAMLLALRPSKLTAHTDDTNDIILTLNGVQWRLKPCDTSALFLELNARTVGLRPALLPSLSPAIATIYEATVAAMKRERAANKSSGVAS